MDNRPIGVFDSGLGGLTAVREMLRILPDEQIIYFGDTGRVPYGSRSRAIITQYSRQDAAFLMSKDVKAIVIACGTASSVAGSLLKEELPVPLTDVLEPTARAAAAATANGRIGIIATDVTVRSGSFQRALHTISPQLQVFAQSCPLFVPIVESGFMLEHPDITKEVAETYLAPLREADVDTVILGCTHYPILKRIIGEVVGAQVRLIDSGRETAAYCRTLLEQNNLLAAQGPGDCSFYVSDRIEEFSKVAGIFLREDVHSSVQLVDIEKYEGAIPWKKTT
ncbi:MULTISPECIES: glutamate racemase [Caproicibacterium]|uniref:Glutamate racemase n=1 Tax=Caproicibacterium argilliputei TaxID=3030016 RepID=A0AA97D7Y8_9FIRM|nr:glutamate racemase [Caproicibacterium argilliputei]WOC31999.1 glutamate racemase [Caproicibacterium argilliputei]